MPLWLRHAIVKWITGTALAAMTAIVLVTLGSTVLSDLQEYGQDLGLRLNTLLHRFRTIDELPSDRAGDQGRGGQQGFGTSSYVFLDIDPGIEGDANSSSRSAGIETCAALAKADAVRYRLGQRPPEESSANGRSAVFLNCSSARPVNRYMLAELVQKLERFEPRAIVIDILLNRESDVIGSAEDKALADVLGAAPGTRRKVPVIWVDSLVRAKPRQSPELVRLEGERLLKPAPADGLYAAASLPVPDSTVRRYPKCLTIVPEGTPVESVPWLAAQLAHASDGRPERCSSAGPAAEDNAPRIVYTLPSLQTHQDDTNAHRREALFQYAPAYNRCLGENFWNPLSDCSRADTYMGKVVVIGGSNPDRRDRHNTPLGEMSGAEVMVNAMLSFELYPHNHDKSLPQLLVKKIRIVLVCSLLWLAYFCLTAWLRGKCIHELKANRDEPKWKARFRSLPGAVLRAIPILALHLVTLAAVCLVAVYMSYSTDTAIPALDVLIPVLAIAVDVYVEKAADALHWLEHLVEEVLLPSSARDPH
ncbi:CHASE2 domain-containing protein [Variovorax ureilyticus]|uniref:CHASE2 domain-containing protein n=1 Tax=Variovorax ureilyticus TaxID=1836198 RepID=A0ABU8VNP0_9BURK